MRRVHLLLLVILVLFCLGRNTYASPYDQNLNDNYHFYTQFPFSSGVNINTFSIGGFASSTLVTSVKFYGYFYNPGNINTNQCNLTLHLQFFKNSGHFESGTFIHDPSPNYIIQEVQNQISPGYFIFKTDSNGSPMMLTDLDLNNNYKTYLWLEYNRSDSCNFDGYPDTAIVIYDSLSRSNYISTWSSLNNSYTPYILFNTESNKIPILIIPGVLGSDIQKSGDLLWANTKMSLGADGFMDPLAFNSDLNPVDNSLSVKSIIRQVSVAFFHFDYTDGLITQLTSPIIGYTEGQDLFTFPYDWRFGVSSSTVDQLAGEINYILTQTDAGKAASKVNLVAHSTGGLLVKKYVMEHPNNHGIGRAIFVGVPNLGAPKALKVLTVGDDFDVTGLDPSEMKKIAQNMPIVYDLAPDQEYWSQAGSLMRIHNPFLDPGNVDKDLDFQGAWDSLVSNKYANSQAVTNSSQLHSIDFDNYNLAQAGVDLYSVMGCKVATFGKFSEIVTEDKDPIFDFPKVTSGDGTVPLLSSDSLEVSPTKTFFIQNTEHSKLLSANGSRQQIVNLLTGSTLSTDGKILTRSEVANKPGLCQIKGESINIKSPVNIQVKDQDGNIDGFTLDGSIQSDIPGSDYEIWGDHKYLFLPTDGNQQYQINLTGTGSGTFTLDDQAIDNDQIIQTQVFSNIPVTPNLTGRVNLGSTTTLTIFSTPTSTQTNIQPSSVIDSEKSKDITAPVSTSSLIGTLGNPGFYRSDVQINISATDTVIPNLENQTSGLLNIYYSLDGLNYQIYNPNTSLVITTEGQHILKYYSTDKAGNNESEHSTTFIIDKTPPELTVNFNPLIQDLNFNGIDNNPGIKPITISDQENLITAIDQAGNATRLQLIENDRKHVLNADIASLTYNGIPVDLQKTAFHFDWLFDKDGNLQMLNQKIQSKNGFNILATYSAGKTILSGKDQNGFFTKTLSGVVLLKLTTHQGDFTWSY